MWILGSTYLYGYCNNEFSEYLSLRNGASRNYFKYVIGVILPWKVLSPRSIVWSGRHVSNIFSKNSRG